LRTTQIVDVRQSRVTLTRPVQAAPRSRQAVLLEFCGVSAMRSFSGQERTWFEHTALSQIDPFSDIPQQGAAAHKTPSFPLHGHHME
jgi:hypothetical protein